MSNAEEPRILRRMAKAHRRGHDTEFWSQEAAEPHAATIRLIVLQDLRDHPGGLTDDEGGGLHGRDRLWWGRRRNECCDLGLVVDSGLRRLTPAGRYAIVWRLATSRHVLARVGTRPKTRPPLVRVGAA